MLKFIKTWVFKFLPNKSFEKGVGIIVSGVAVEQLLLVIISPILTRIYSPDDFGLFAVFINMLALVGVISSLRYQLAIPLPEDNTEAANLTALSLLTLILVTLLLAVLVILTSESFAKLLNLPSLTLYIWLLPISIFLSGVFVVLSHWFLRKKSFNVIATTKIYQTITMIAAQVTTFKFGGIGLLLGLFMGQCMGVSRLAWLSSELSIFKNVSFHGIKEVAKRYLYLPFFRLGGH